MTKHGLLGQMTVSRFAWEQLHLMVWVLLAEGYSADEIAVELLKVHMTITRKR